MNKLCCLIILFVGCGICEGQNLVFNPSFENYTVCPDSIGKIYLAIGWDTARNSPDYFNACCTDTFPNGQHIAGVPLNWAGNRSAASGVAYTGVIAKWQGSEEREAIKGQLISPLLIGQKYYTSFKISLAGQANPFNYCGINKLGILFSTFPYSGINPVSLFCNCAQVYSDSIVTDTLNWTRLTGTFIADSSYTYLSIGRLFSNSMIDSIQVMGGGCNTYYYIDDICVSTDSIFTYNYSYTGVEDLIQGNTMSCFPNPSRSEIKFQWQGNEQTTIYLYDILSRQVLQQAFTNSISINTGQLSKGIYFYEVRNKNGVIKKGKVVKE